MSRVDSIIRHIKQQYPDYAPDRCLFHSSNRACLTLLNSFNSERFHCLFANSSPFWRSYSVTKSCDLPDHFYDLIELNRLLGDRYVLPFASQFRESSGYTVAMYRQTVGLHRPQIIDRQNFKRTVFGLIVLYVAVCYTLGGVPPDIKHFSFVYTTEHPVLCDFGGPNAEKKYRVDGKVRFNRKRWVKFLRRKKCDKFIRYLKIYFPKYFQKKKKGRRCILKEDEEGVAFDHVTHKLVCQNMTLFDILQTFPELTSDSLTIRYTLIPEWLRLAEYTTARRRLQSD